MADVRRPSPFIWVTWLAAALAGDRQCAFAPWYKAHYTYEKRADDRAFDLMRWKADHADLLRARIETLRASGCQVMVEDQNKFVVRGKAATLSGCPDLVVREEGVVVIEDCKTGQPRDEHYWQVVLYMLFSPERRRADADGDRVIGSLVYSDRDVRAIEERHADVTARQRAVAAIQFIAHDVAPSPTPSVPECNRCDILNCAYRAREDDVATVRGIDLETEEF